uniref:Uncharacterized protein n=1 Tax=Micrurus lemniscatus lemniscatus TaxID=129467 RepID=A0A2D4JLB0_MICLE
MNCCMRDPWRSLILLVFLQTFHRPNLVAASVASKKWGLLSLTLHFTTHSLLALMMLPGFVVGRLQEGRRAQRVPRTPDFRPELQIFSLIDYLWMSPLTEGGQRAKRIIPLCNSYNLNLSQTN